ncbi:MAG: DotU family type IV/VI secretion system protein [Oceanospirillaceae bacterium]|nr:DotU family type IV/VI secretion system protein [Oceanospirillaceae bacterium]
MSSDDPFSSDNNDRTVIRPAPGGRKPMPGAPSQPAQQSYTPPAPQQPAYQQPPSQLDANVGSSMSAHAGAPSYPSAQRGNADKLSLLKGSGLNPLVDHSYTLLLLATQLRKSVSQQDIGTLKADLIQQIRLFEDSSRASGINQETTLTARYILCTFLDENIMSTPWGSESNWGSQTLLSTFHNENWGGEKFFLVLDKLKPDTATNLHILEFIYLCLLFGFRGKYGVVESGASQLLTVQDELYRSISMTRGDFERELSPRWQGVPDKRNVLVKYVPLWVVIALAGLLLLLVYSGFRYIVSTSTAPIYQQVNQLEIEHGLVPGVTPDTTGANN